jgi:hypothetical protein
MKNFVSAGFNNAFKRAYRSYPTKDYIQFRDTTIGTENVRAIAKSGSHPGIDSTRAIKHLNVLFRGTKLAISEVRDTLGVAGEEC